MKSLLRVICGLELGALALTKILAAGFLTGVRAPVIAALEALLAVWILSGRARRLAAGGMLLLGLAFCGWTIALDPASGHGGCGCFGPYEVGRLGHALVAAGLLVTGGLYALALDAGHRSVCSPRTPRGRASPDSGPHP